MPAALAEVKAEWHRFRDDKPGERFCNHRERAKKQSRSHNIVTLALGVLLLVAGVVFLFIPGPGIPLIIFGLALIASHSSRLSQLLDRAEPRIREQGRHLADWWHARSRTQKIAMVATFLVVATLFLMAIWKWVVAAYLL